MHANIFLRYYSYNMHALTDLTCMKDHLNNNELYDSMQVNAMKCIDQALFMQKTCKNDQ
jgi:hypothetical protein